MKGFCLLFLLLFSTVSNAANLWDSRQLLLDKQFDILEANFFEADQALLNNQAKALHIHFFTYDSLWKRKDFLQNEILESLQEWRLTKPDSYAPLVALGKYHLNYGYFLRGGKFIKSTSNEQVANMETQHQKAKLFFLEALNKNSLSLFSYIGLVTLDKTIPVLEQNSKQDWTQKVKETICSSRFRLVYDYAWTCEQSTINLSKTNIFKNAPKEVLKVPQVWKRFVQNYTPRWGGSYETMESIINQSRDFLSKDQRLQLSEVIITDKMDALIRRKQFNEAEKLGLEFLTNAEETNSYKHEEFSGYVYALLARNYMKSKKYEKCIKYSELASKLYLWNHHTWSNYGFCAMSLNSFELANFAFRYSVDTEPELDAWSAFYLGMSYLRIKNYKLAFLLLSKSVELDNTYSKFADSRLEWLKENEPESAVPGKLIHAEIVGKIYYDGILLD